LAPARQWLASFISAYLPKNRCVKVAMKATAMKRPKTASTDAMRYFTEAQPLFEQSGTGSNVLQVRGNLALVTGLEAQRRGDEVAARQAFEEALSLFEQAGGAANARDQRPSVRQLLAELGVQPTANPSTAAAE
jgi:hypothetical protein